MPGFSVTGPAGMGSLTGGGRGAGRAFPRGAGMSGRGRRF